MENDKAINALQQIIGLATTGINDGIDQQIAIWRAAHEVLYPDDSPELRAKTEERYWEILRKRRNPELNDQEQLENAIELLEDKGYLRHRD